MFLLPTRARRWPLTLIASSLATLGACADDVPHITAPSAHPNRPSLAVGDVITVTSSRGGTEEGTLRWAVAQTTGGEVIRFDTRLAGATITLDSTLVIPNAITIEGPTDGVTLSGGGRGRVIDIPLNFNSAETTTLRNLNITGGMLTADGGAGIRAAEPLRLQHVTVWGNEALTAAAILTTPATTLTLFNSTVSGNTSTEYLATAIRIGGGASIQNSTIVYNTQGGIGFSDVEFSTLSNSIVAHNGTGRDNCRSTEKLQLWDANIATDLTCGDSTMIRITDPLLGTLRDNGGPSLTHAVGFDSPAFNGAGGPCATAVDQRYQPRDAACDIGAYESTERATVSLAIDRIANLNPAGSVAVISGTTRCARAGDQLVVAVKVEQRAADKAVTTGTGTTTVACTTAGAPWSALVYPSGGTFKSGNASATAATQQTPTWVAPASASRSVKLTVPEV